MAVERPWTLTLRQYERAMMDDFMARNDNPISKAMYRRYYPNDCRRAEWVREIEVAAQRGEIIPIKVLDALFNFNERVGWAILRYADGRRDYMPPYVRARQKALKRDEIEMQRRVRSMVRGS